MGRFSGKSCRFSTMLLMTSTFFLVEIIVGYLTNSIALVADSFHMLSDVVALIVGFVSIKISKWPSKRNTYGWVRAEVLGALVNSVFLLALCFSILVESLKRLVELEEVDNPKLMLIVGGLGLLVNIIGLFLFSGHGHSHGGQGHGHSHGGGGHSKGNHAPADKGKGHGHHDYSHSDGNMNSHSDLKNGADGEVENEALVPSQGLSSVTVSDDKETYIVENSILSDSITIEMKQPNASSSASMNMRGVFLHVLGDALGSVVVVVSALVIWFASGDWKYYVDPAMSILMVAIILSTTVPLFKESAFILLQTVPSHVDVETIKTELEKIDGIVGVHECHIWQLAGNRIVASAHVRCRDIEEYMTLAAKIKTLFHRAGIHSTTIQPEFFDYFNVDSKGDQVCALLCTSTGEVCKDTCCGSRSSNPNNKNETQSGLNNSNSNLASSNPENAQGKVKSRSFASKMSVDGDEVVLEMSEVTTN